MAFLARAGFIRTGLAGAGFARFWLAGCVLLGVCFVVAAGPALAQSSEQETNLQADSDTDSDTGQITAQSEDQNSPRQADLAQDNSGQSGTEEQPSPQSPASSQAGDSPRLVVVEINGLIDKLIASYLREEVAAAAQSEALAVTLQLNSGGTTLGDNELAELLAVIDQAELPVGVWVGPSGAVARGGAAHLVSAADFAALSPGSTLGEWSELASSDSVGASATGRVPTGRVPTDPAQAAQIFDAAAALEAGFTQASSPSVGEFLLALSDAEIIQPISTEVTRDDGLVQRTLSPEVSVSFVQLSLLDSLFHTAASPAIAYLLLLAGISMVLLEFFTGGVGVAAAVGIGSLGLSAYGLGELDVRVWALVALVLAFLAFAVDLQSGIKGFWTPVGCVLLLVGSLFLFGRHSLSWLPLLTGLVLTTAFMLIGIPTLIRTRYGTATVGRDWLIGGVGVAATDINPTGVLEIDSAQWSARAHRLAPLLQGERGRVTSISGVVLEVEPEVGLDEGKRADSPDDFA